MTYLILQFNLITAHCAMLTHQKEVLSPSKQCKFFLSILRKSNLGVILKSQIMIYAFFFNLKGMQVKLLVPFNIFKSEVRKSVFNTAVFST